MQQPTLRLEAENPYGKATRPALETTPSGMDILEPWGYSSPKMLWTSSEPRRTRLHTPRREPPKIRPKTANSEAAQRTCRRANPTPSLPHEDHYQRPRKPQQNSRPHQAEEAPLHPTPTRGHESHSAPSQDSSRPAACRNSTGRTRAHTATPRPLIRPRPAKAECAPDQIAPPKKPQPNSHDRRPP